MFNRRWKRILLWTLSVLVVLGVGGLFAANYAVDKLMSSMAGGLDLESEDNVAVNEDLGTTPEATVKDDEVVPVETATPTSSNIEVGENVEGGLAKGETVGETAEDTGTTATNKPTTATSKPTTATSKPTQTSTPVPTPTSTSKDGYTAQVSTDKAKDIQENVTIKEKADVASIIMGQLSVSDMNRLKDLASGGLNLEEKREARSIILGKVSEEQYNELSQIAKKYGISQGKTRDQIIAEEEQLQAKEKGSE